MKRLAVSILNFYRNYLSPLKLRCSRFYLSCSEYTKDEIEKDVDNDPNLNSEEKKKEKARLNNHLEHYEKGLDLQT